MLLAPLDLANIPKLNKVLTIKPVKKNASNRRTHRNAHFSEYGNTHYLKLETRNTEILKKGFAHSNNSIVGNKHYKKLRKSEDLTIFRIDKILPLYPL